MLEAELNSASTFHGRLAIEQRVLPAYRIPFFDALAAACEDGLCLLAGQPRPEEAIAAGGKPSVAQLFPARNRHVFHPGSPFYLCWQSGLPRWLDECQPDALILEANPRYLSTPRAARWMRRHNLPVLGWGLGAAGSGGGLRLSGWRRFLGQFDGLIAYSQRGAEQYRQLGFSPERVFVALNAASAPPAGPLPRRGAGFGGRPTVLFVGRLQARKRVDLLLRACASLPPNLLPRLWVVGDGPELSQLQSLAQRVYPAAEFIGAQRGADLLPYFMGADLFVLPGTGGLAVQEAMAQGLPVIAAEGDGTQEDLVRPENGWRVPPGDLDALAVTLHEALSDAPRLRSMGAASYRIVQEEANIDHMVQVFIRAVNELTAALRQAR
jgi:glycosyltransferase involved in cell wall biosynthesis